MADAQSNWARVGAYHAAACTYHSRSERRRRHSVEIGINVKHRVTTAPARSAGVVGTARREGDAGNRGDPSRARVAASTSPQAAALAGVGQGRRSVEAG